MFSRRVSLPVGAATHRRVFCLDFLGMIRLLGWMFIFLCLETLDFFEIHAYQKNIFLTSRQRFLMVLTCS